MFAQQVVWITGASSGIGEALALEFAAAGSIPVLSARREAELQRVQRSCIERGAPQALVVPLDITDLGAVQDAVALVQERLGRIDLLINNAGISQRSLCVDTDLSVYRDLFEVDVMGQIALTKQVLPLMLEQGSGHIAVTSSVAGKIGVPYRTGYCAAKHAVMGFFDALRGEVAHHGILVSTIVPGYIRTNISVNALKGDGSRFGSVDQAIAGGMDAARCAQVIVKALSKGTPEIPVGEGFEMKALWIKRLFPGVVFKKAAEMARK